MISTRFITVGIDKQIIYMITAAAVFVEDSGAITVCGIYVTEAAPSAAKRMIAAIMAIRPASRTLSVLLHLYIEKLLLHLLVQCLTIVP